MTHDRGTDVIYYVIVVIMIGATAWASYHIHQFVCSIIS
jgi:hypothetical protein